MEVHGAPTLEARQECINWWGRRHSQGYGVTRWPASGLAHRYIFREVWGWLPEEPHVLDHICRNRLCVNPEHLQVVTRSENTKLGSARANKTHCNYGHSDWAVKGDGYKRCAECHRLRNKTKFR